MTSDYLKRIQQNLQFWPGECLDSAPFVKQLNTKGVKQTVFWCFQASHEFESLARALGEDVSLYGLRSGHLVMEYTPENIDRLTGLFCEQILTVCENKGIKQVTLGGNCQGATLMLRTAEKLEQTANLDLSIVVLESIYPSELAAPVTLVFGRNSSYNLYRRYHHVDCGLMSYYSTYRVAVMPGAHGQFFRSENVTYLARIIKNEHRSKSEVSKKDVPFMLNAPKLISDNVLSAVAVMDIALGVSELTANQHCELSVVLKNVSSQIIAGKQICLANQWYNASSRTLYQWLDGIAQLPELAPNEETTVRLRVRAPFSGGQYVLGLRLSIEGAAYAELETELPVDVTASSKALRISTLPTQANHRQTLMSLARAGACDKLVQWLASSPQLTRRQWLLLLHTLAMNERWQDIATVCESLQNEEGFERRFIAAYMEALIKLSQPRTAVSVFHAAKGEYPSEDRLLNNFYLNALIFLGDVQTVYQQLCSSSQLNVKNKEKLFVMLLAPHVVKMLSQEQVECLVDNLSKQNPNADAFLKMTNALLGQGLTARARVMLQEAHGLFPHNIALALRFARISDELGRQDDARPIFERVLQLAPGNSEALAWLAANKKEGLNVV
tara:strand:+ start:5678 stop:7516 length:1839 start_codon:yes stop_codon:yes gene_type:complete